jgi:hypothetical protein
VESQSDVDVKFWDLVNPNSEFADSVEANKRLDVCRECPRFFKPTTQCKECKCIMKLKTKLKQAQCPIGKW